MTPENDKTLRGLFHKHRIGFNEWNDRREYRLNYEKQYSIGNKSNNRNRLVDYLISNSRKVSIIEDDPRKSQNEEDYIMWLGKYFHESKIYQEMKYIWSFGMCRDEDGNFTNCDCCGNKLHIFNTTGHGMCDNCEITHRYKIDQYDIN